MFPQNRILRKSLKTFGIVLLMIGILFAVFLWRIRVPAPNVDSDKTVASYERIQVGPNHYRVDKCWLRKNQYGVWEMYLEGTPYERGLIYGILARELMEKQEVHFVNQIKEMIPGSLFLQVLKGFVGWFNRDIYKYIPTENQQEIYGVSQSFSDQFNYIGPKYYRILNYHAAHDIGHALTDLNMVGCTSFAVNKALSSDSTLLIGRNFDFYMGDDFAEDKLIVFMNPDKGYKFASYAWAGLTGVVSGMNEKGITVTLNASKSDIPFSAREPISILAREILQYASTIEEAKAIAQRSETFVSESLLIGSALDNDAAIIEKSPQKMDVFTSTAQQLVCANHYQSKAFAMDSVNIQNIRETDSKSRFDRMNQLLARAYPIDEKKAAAILRDKNGINDQFIGYGNPSALNQLIAHHGILFKPARQKLWISTQPYQLGRFICYDLTNVFAQNGNFNAIDSLAVAADPFLDTQEYVKFEHFKKIRQHIQKLVMIGIPFTLSEADEKAFILDNPQSYLTFLALGDYHLYNEHDKQAIQYYRKALGCVVASENERRNIREKISKLENAQK
jgi:isopenicillin-N N-acyltransferase-like protein